MNIIITAGGTTEKIDDVRVISNFSSGKLGLAVADAFLSNKDSKLEKIYYLCEKNINAPDDARVEVVRVTGVQNLLDSLRELLTTKKIDAVIHAMAVSDYAVKTVTTLNELKESEFRADELKPQTGKISSEIDDLVIILKRTPKVIGEIKKIQKDTLLVGFKLLTNVPKETLIDTAYNLMQKNSCDMVLANDLANIAGDRHVGYLIFPDKSYETLNTKQEIAEAIARNVEKIVEAKGGM